MPAPATYALAIGMGANTLTPIPNADTNRSTVPLRTGVVDTANQATPSIAEFERLASEDPARLVAWLPALSAPDLTHALEALGTADAELALPALTEMVREHPKSYVREGALYGLERLSSQEALAEIARSSTHDPSPGIREVAAEILEEG